MTLKEFLELAPPSELGLSYFTNKLNKTEVLISLPYHLGDLHYIVWSLLLNAPIDQEIEIGISHYCTEPYDYNHWKQILSSFNQAGKNGERISWEEIMELYGFNEYKKIT